MSIQMSATVVGGHPNRASRFYAAPIGKKAVMAVTGVVLFGFVLGHLAGNLQVFEGQHQLDSYAAFLKATPVLLWGTRLVLLVSVILHIVASIQLTQMKRAARPVAYAKKNNSHSSFASRTMMWSGPFIAFFIAFHLMHFTLGTGQPNFNGAAVFGNIVQAFQSPLVAFFYIFAMLLLGTHLHHGLYSMFQTLGANHPSFMPVIKRVAALGAILITAGFIAIPVAVLAGVIHT